jgi:hypothetical protein
MTPSGEFLWLLGGIVFISIVAGTVALALSERDHDNSNQTSTVHHNEPTTGTKRSMSDYEWRIVVLTALIAVITAIYAAFSALQWGELISMTEATKESADASVISVRAWVLTDGTELTGNRLDIPYILKFRNVGKTPARNILIAVEFKVQDSVRPEPVFTKCPNDPDSAVIPYIRPDEPFSDNRQLPHATTEERRISLAGKPGTLYVHGCVSYFDLVSNQQRLTEFCQDVSVGTLCHNNNKLE